MPSEFSDPLVETRTRSKRWLYGLNALYLVLGIVIIRIFGVAGGVGIACALPCLMLFSEIRRLKTNYTGPLRAIAGLSFSLLLSCSGALLFILLIQPSFLGGGFGTTCCSNLNADFKSLQNALDMYRLNCGNYPTSVQGLEALVSKPSIAPTPTRWSQIMKTEALDPWKNPYVYKFPGKKNANKPEIISKGPDGIEGNKDDISSQDD